MSPKTLVSFGLGLVCVAVELADNENYASTGELHIDVNRSGLRRLKGAPGSKQMAMLRRVHDPCTGTSR